MELELPGAEASPATVQAGEAGAEPGEAPLLDEGELFVLDLDDEAPESLVIPPPDMLEDSELRGAAWGERGAWSAPPAEAAAPPPVETPAKTPPAAGGDSLTDTFEFELDLEADADGLLETVDEAEPEPAATPLGDELDHALLERTAAEVAPERIAQPEDLLTEAEVLIKYGIAEKALERLSELLQREPDNLEAFRLMIGVHLEAGHHARVAALAGELLAISARLGEDTVWPGVRSELEAAGYRVEGERVHSPPEAAPEGGEPPVEVAAEVAAEAQTEAQTEAPPEARPEAESGRELELELDDDLLPAAEEPSEGLEVAEPEAAPEAAPEAETPVVPAAEAEEATEPPAPPKKGRRARGDVEATLADLAGRFLGPKRKKRTPPAQPPPEPPPPPAELPAAPPPPAAEPPAAPPAEPPPPAAGAVDPLRALGDSLREEIDLAGEGEEEAAVAAGGEGAGDLDDTGVSWLDEVPAATSADQAMEDEDAFFDLGAELEQELSAEDALAEDELLIGGADQSLEEIVEGFKRGVAENLSPEDHDTHFDLGIAYREMGLLDEAIGEFQLAAKDPGFLVTCASMLGLCFLEKGLPELAVKWYRRGLEAPGISEEEQLGLLYDLGNAQAAAGDSASAYHTFVDLYGVNTNYRDVVARLAELEPRH